MSMFSDVGPHGEDLSEPDMDLDLTDIGLPTKQQMLAAWLDDNLNSIDPGVDEIAQLVFSKMLVEHSCCDTQTWQFKDELHQKILRTENAD